LAIFLLDSELYFPDPELSEPNGLLALGGDLRPERLLLAYKMGIFPWYNEPNKILWWSPLERCVFFPSHFHESRSLKKILKKKNFQVTYNQNYSDVVRFCAEIKRKDQEGTWILPEMIAAYEQLFILGYAHSVEVKKDGKWWGGLYGVQIGGVFFAESMFSAQKNGSKIALSFLVKKVIKEGVGLIDCQLSNPHLLSLGAEEVARKRYLSLLQAAGKPLNP